MLEDRCAKGQSANEELEMSDRRQRSLQEAFNRLNLDEMPDAAEPNPQQQAKLAEDE